MNKLFIATLVAASFSLPAFAAGDHVVAQATAPAATAADMTDGEIRKVDKGNSKLTIKHGELKNLDMPAMTMVFQVKDPALLDKVKAGDKVRFKAEKAGTAFVVTEVEAAK
ncbi:copper-binding protein [Methylibium sp.]|uniref:copper-binding protein n=1 Tax=Methylibium sp. TaxID=2067992 RepID=UPI0017C534BA|nr:copper-binding protein [Methylibium sp.]MBA3591220.1 copper-binding protein [Methylibium sp.]